MSSSVQNHGAFSSPVFINSEDSSEERGDCIARWCRQEQSAVKPWALTSSAYLEELIHPADSGYLCVVQPISGGVPERVSIFGWSDSSLAEDSTREFALLSMLRPPLYGMKKAQILSTREAAASPIKQITINHALELLGAIPVGAYSFTIVPEPEGSIGFDWPLSDDVNFGISVYPDGEVLYGGWIEGEDADGVFQVRDGIPGRLRALFAKLSN